MAAFQGSLDNREELAHRLKDDGRLTGPASPAVTLLAAFRSFGEQTPNLLRGVYAAIVWDGSRLWCFRDHLGCETLFFREEPRAFYAATEAKQVLAGSQVAREPDVEFVEQFFFREVVEQQRCALKGVRRLPKRTLLVRADGQARTTHYWHPESLLESADLSHEEIKERFDELAAQAARRVLTGKDVVSLSGGIDSPAVAAYAAPEHLRLTGGPLAAITAVFPDFRSVDERPYVEMVADHLGLSLHTYEPAVSSLERVQHWVDTFDGPWDIWSHSATEEALRHAHLLGFRCMLTGEFAEWVIDNRAYLLSHLLLTGRMRAAGRQFASQRSAGEPARPIVRQVVRELAPRSVMRTFRRFRPGFTFPHWLDVRRIASRESGRVVAVSDRWREAQLGFLAGPSLSVEAHTLLEAHSGVRVRRPWADVDLWEFLLSLPVEVKFPDLRRKGLVRELLRDRLPDALLDRQDKTVFNEFVTAGIDYPSLRRWLLSPRHRIRGVDYSALQGHLEREDLNLSGYLWAKDLAGVHAFLDVW